jgi:hypothetical protein
VDEVAKRLIFSIDNCMAGYTNFFDALSSRKREECRNHSLRRFQIFQYPGEHTAFKRPEVDKVRGLAGLEIPGLVCDPQSLGSGTHSEIQHLAGLKVIGCGATRCIR